MVDRIKVQVYNRKQANQVVSFCFRNQFEGVTNDSDRDCTLFVNEAFKSDGVCYIGVQLIKYSSIRISNKHDRVMRQKYLEVSLSKFIEYIKKLNTDNEKLSSGDLSCSKNLSNKEKKNA